MRSLIDKLIDKNRGDMTLFFVEIEVSKKRPFFGLLLLILRFT